jgi:excisionase family DNA binding protein
MSAEKMESPKAHGDTVRVKEAAAFLGVHENTVRRYEQAGKLQGYRDSNGWRAYLWPDLWACKEKITTLTKSPESDGRAENGRNPE